MMQLLCNGVSLDLYENASLQFTHDNPLFAFDNLKCERTTQFKLPSTPKNDLVFTLSRIPAYEGEGMRRKFDAILQSGVVIKEGYLYIDSFDGKDYAAIFVTGEFVGLQTLKDAGKISDILTDTIKNQTICDIGSYGDYAYQYKTALFRQIKYGTDGEFPFPSVRLHDILVLALQQLNVSYVLPTETQYVRTIPDEIGTLGNSAVTLNLYSAGFSTDPDLHKIVYTGVLSDNVSPLFDLGGLSDVMRREGTYLYYGTVRQFVANQKIEISFPEDWNDDYFIGCFQNGGTWYVEEFSFYGDRSFDQDGAVSGESLRGRSVTIEQGAYFTVISRSSYVNREGSSGREQGWDFSNVICQFEMEGKEVGIGGRVRLADGLPEINITDALKTLAALSGKVLYYTDADGITFDNLDWTNWEVFYLDGKIISYKEVKRTFADYQQQNVIQFESGESVSQSQRLEIEYTIDNDNLEGEKELQTIPFSEGSVNGFYSSQALLYNPIGEKALGDADTSSSVSLLRVTLRKNARLQALCAASTQLKLSARMTFYEYMHITPKTLIQADGTRYVWTASSWQKEKAEFTLAKV